MELLIELNKNTITEIASEIDQLFIAFKRDATPEIISAFNTSLTKKSEEWETQIKTLQAKKLARDTMEYQQNKVYRWRHRNTRVRNRRSASMSSASSVGESSDNSQYSFKPMKTRFGGNKRKGDHKFSANKRGTHESNQESSNGPKVINLSEHSFSDFELQLLSKGLTFSPTSRFDPFTAVKDLHIFSRSLIFKKWFHNEDTKRMFPFPDEQEAPQILEELSREHYLPPLGIVPSSLKRKSQKFPSLSVCPNIEIFVQLVTNDFEKIPKNIHDDNLTISERIGLKRLKKLDDVVFKPADKGGNVVVWPCKMYESEAYRQLRDPLCYKKLTYNPMSSYRDLLGKILQTALDKEIITQETRNLLWTKDPSVPTL
ncbi:uncharacterized protein LOC143769306 [Ranitomeya variabilis]|uniref:uncharacterized protein LOC143769306 n=1 Tax=Ranitomeya variabilis TaxID=490064 RepID=UPI004055F2C8